MSGGTDGGKPAIADAPIKAAPAFTPGPWDLHKMSYGYDLAVAGISGGYGGWFVELHGGADDDETIQAEFDATCRLISAAPEMFEALQKAREVIFTDYPCSAELEEIDAALSRATGGQS